MSRSDFAPPETWVPVRRAAKAITDPLQRFLALEAAGGIVLLAATVAALIWANTSPASYEGFWATTVGGNIGDRSIGGSLQFWINDALMTIFFFVVGLEIRRELYEGELSTLRQAALPVAAAFGGMLVPALIFAALNAGRPTAAGWAIPMATDIAFAVGVLTVLGSRVPVALRVLLLALAVIDDIGAIIVISVFYSEGISFTGIGIVAGGVLLVILIRSAGARSPLSYVVPGCMIWIGLLVAGIHPTVAGVLLGLLTPARSWLGLSGFAATTEAQLQDAGNTDREALMSRLDMIERAHREAVSPVERLIHFLHPWVVFGVMPVFALANAGVVLGGASLVGDSLWLFVGIVAGLALGKPIGIVIASLVTVRVGIATRSSDTWRGVQLVGFVAGIGFTMSLFIAQLAFPVGPYLDTAKLAILVGSGTAIVVALAFGFGMPRRAS